MFDSGAAVVDVGGESTRPGALPVGLEEERRRTLPVVRRLARHGAVSIDTRKAELAEEAVANGASIINDTSGLLAPVAGRLGVGYVGMHCRGVPATMQQGPRYVDVVHEVWEALDALATKAAASGARQIWIDPGIGFGKTHQHNLALLQALPEVCAGQWPVLLGASRKSVIGELTGRVDPRQRAAGSLGVVAAAWCAGVDMIRTYDVAESRDMLAVLTTVSSRDAVSV